MEYLPTIRQLAYLKAIAEQGSFIRAANACNVTQSTLSAGIAALENLLGQTVIDRSRRQIRLTPLGQDVLRESRMILDHAANITARARMMATPLSGPLRMGIIPTIAPYLLPQILPALQDDFPLLALQIREEQSADLVQQCRDGALDVIILAFPYDMPELESETLYDEHFYLACPQGSWPNRATGARLKDLDETQILLLEEGHCLRDHALAACKLQPRRSRDIFNATSLQTLIQFVAHGYGMTLLPESAVTWGSLPAGIDIVTFAPPQPGRTVGLAWRRNHPQQPEFAMLAETIRRVTKLASGR